MNQHQLEALRPELTAWNAANRHAALAHEREPITACLGIRIADDGTEHPCPNLQAPSGGQWAHLCKGCRDEARRVARQKEKRWTTTTSR